VCGVAGSSPWLVGFRLLWLDLCVPRSGSVWLGVVVQHLFMVRGSGYDMTSQHLGELFLRGLLFYVIGT
jgi:hypothetical protein